MKIIIVHAFLFNMKHLAETYSCLTMLKMYCKTEVLYVCMMKLSNEYGAKVRPYNNNNNNNITNA